MSHTEIFYSFTPDEEIGRGTDYFDFNKIKADIAYTVDGKDLGEVNYENFNAASVKIEIDVINTHAGSAKGKTVNSLLLAIDINNAIPNETPSNTEIYEDFYHLEELKGNVNNSTIKYIIRDHDNIKFQKRKQVFEDIVKDLNLKYNNCISLKIKDSYFNMKDVISKNMEIVENALKSTKNLEIESIIMPIRGGTDGARLSYNGLSCPNLGTGGHNFHSIYEYIALEDMEKVTKILIEIVKSYTERNNKLNCIKKQINVK